MLEVEETSRAASFHMAIAEDLIPVPPVPLEHCPVLDR